MLWQNYFKIKTIYSQNFWLVHFVLTIYTSINSNMDFQFWSLWFNVLKLGVPCKSTAKIVLLVFINYFKLKNSLFTKFAASNTIKYFNKSYILTLMYLYQKSFCQLYKIHETWIKGFISIELSVF